MSADYIVFNEGAQYLETHGNGLPATCYFLLSTKAVSSFVLTDTLAGGVAEITGTGYARQSQAAPTPVGPLTTFAQMTWTTGTAVNWPASVQSLVLATTANNTGYAICAWNLVPCLGSTALTPVSIATSGGTGAAGVYYWTITALTAGGETPGNNYSAYVPVSGTATLSWTAIPGATSYNLYRATTLGGVNTTPAKVSAGVTSPFTDTMAAVAAGAAPTANTTQGACVMNVSGYSLLVTPTITTGA